MSNWLEIFNPVLTYLSRDPKLATGAAILAIIIVIWFTAYILNFLSGLLEHRHPLTEQQRKRLTLAAPYFSLFNFNYYDLKGKKPFARIRIRYLIKKSWGITDHGSAISTLDSLLHSGHRSDSSYYQGITTAQDQALVEKALIAWDMVRLVFLARVCVSLGFIGESIMDDYHNAAAKLVQPHFSSWETWGKAFLDGRALWSRREDTGYELTVNNLLKKRNSIWRKISWEQATAS